jgi:anthranilate phosphoribosyltransferase
VHGEDHGDEISITGKTTVCHLKDGDLKSYQIEPEMVGMKRASLETIRGGGPEKNAQILLKILGREPGPPRDVVLLNAAAIFMAAGKVSDLQDGVQLAQESIDSGRAKKKLEALIQFSQRAG